MFRPVAVVPLWQFEQLVSVAAWTNFPPAQLAKAAVALLWQVMQSAPLVLTPQGAVRLQLFAGEPDVCQPIAMCFDDRGRLWVAEAYSYPVRRPDKEAKDRILIFEDTKGAGKFDKRTVFMEGLNLVSGLEVGFGGVWIGAAPYLMYVPIKEGEDKPAGEWEPLIAKLRDIYRNDPDAGIHGAAEWALRQWKQQEKLKAIDAELKNVRDWGERRWYVNTG